VGVSIGASFAGNFIGSEGTGCMPMWRIPRSRPEAPEPDGTADENIKAAVLALSAAVAPGGVGVAVSGVGSVAINEITSEVDSYIDNSTVTAGSVDLTADDTSQIMAFTGAASVAAASAAWA